MPNIVAHLICGKLVANKLMINDDKYLKGNLYPDYVDKKKHYRIQGKKFEVPDLDKFVKFEKGNDKLFKMGFLTHLMLDKLFLDDFVINNIYTKLDNSVNIFESDGIYQDYTNMSRSLLNHYNLSIDEIDNLMLSESEYIDVQKYRSNVDVIKTNKKEEKLKYIDLKKFINFLNDSADKISAYVKKYYN